MTTFPIFEIVLTFAMHFKAAFLCLIGIVSWYSVQCQFIYIHGAAFKFVTGLNIPVDIQLEGGGLSWFTNFQAIYTLPDNVTFFEPYKILQKRSVKNTFNRFTIYQALEKFLSRLGISGNECIQKLICEVSAKRFYGLFGDVLQILFSPQKDTHYGLEKHRKAQWHGMNNETSCNEIYKNCFLDPNSIFSI